MRKVFLDDLPRTRLGKFIDWLNCADKIVKFTFDDIDGELKIIKYCQNTRKVEIKYKDYFNYKINTSNFIRCQIQSYINNITISAPWMIPYFQGGYSEAIKYTKSSGEKIFPVCPNCGKIKTSEVYIRNIYKNRSIGCECSDGISYSEKFISNFLNQLNIEYIAQYKYDNLNNKKYRFDFAILSKLCIIEANGRQHYEKSFEKMGGRTLNEERRNDINKKSLAIDNGILNYIVLDCRESNLNWLKLNIMNSELPNIFDFKEDDIDWIQCHEFALKNLIKIVSEYKNLYPKLTASEIGYIFKLSTPTISNYLKIGTDLKWCNYNAQEELDDFYKKLAADKMKKVEVFKNNISVGVFNSLTLLSENSVRLFGIVFNKSTISRAANNNKKYKGFTFKYIL